MESLQKEIERTVTDLEVNLVRPLQKEAFLCSARACDTAKSGTDFQRSLQMCNAPVQQIEHVVNHELQDFQQKVQRCIQRCQDVAQDSAQDAKQSDIEKIQGVMMKCVNECGDHSASLLPKLTKRIYSAAGK
mmetsp:Transcript_42093/g.51061  ORF Transcript_42093/g.51061 Transcript_42093/m.51061 type:complete len:132 (-) Transcript_42093:178-573(-)|eukprot:CAMPEP_0197858976 /NCGR_PEP_ID=MMETSP1438-20131217/33196_1 /TAXON_ID=1461541 /ORGANISM="Pterosperma sp., Strain CCMP1384" /LENGTH=131 /DNA_ID=CAMNT_0043475313 /DNA_START=111 /DNA_END=506 /DNA_ORIENTATION=-